MLWFSGFPDYLILEPSCGDSYIAHRAHIRLRVTLACLHSDSGNAKSGDVLTWGQEL